MTSDVIYEAILAGITQAHQARLDRSECVSIALTPGLLDEMAQNAAQAIVHGSPARWRKPLA